MRVLVASFFTLALLGCQNENRENAKANAAWAKCTFELDKIEALRGRNLDDLDKGGSVARNQFLMNCLAVEGAGPTVDQISEMSTYAANKAKRSTNDVSLNSGER